MQAIVALVILTFCEVPPWCHERSPTQELHRFTGVRSGSTDDSEKILSRQLAQGPHFSPSAPGALQDMWSWVPPGEWCHVPNGGNPWLDDSRTGRNSVWQCRDIPVDIFRYLLACVLLNGLVFRAGWRCDERSKRVHRAGSRSQVFVKHLVHPTWLWAAHRVCDRDHHPPEGAAFTEKGRVGQILGAW